MSSHKIGGCCSLCDKPCFEIMAVWEEHDVRAGEPKRLGAANDGTTKISFLLLNGGYTDMTFCGECAGTVGPDQYTLLWRKNLAGYMREQNGNPEKFLDQFPNGLLCELGRQQLKEVKNG